jgi:hypothetical protein
MFIVTPVRDSVVCCGSVDDGSSPFTDTGKSHTPSDCEPVPSSPAW